MSVFRFRGGVHPTAHKASTSDQPILTAPIPERLYIPLLQHVGPAATPVVKVGDHVLKGQLIARASGAVCAPVHASSSGTVAAINNFQAPHPSGLPVMTIILDCDGNDTSVTPEIINDPFNTDPDELAVRVGAAGVVGMGGATFPAAVKLKQARRSNIKTLIINGGECEPYLTCDDRIMQERAAAIVDGVRIMQYIVEPESVIIAIEDNKPAAIRAMRDAVKGVDHIRVEVAPTCYPLGSAKQMIQAVTGLEVPAGARSNDLGVLVHNVGTAFAVHRAIRDGQPLISRIITVGGAVAKPQNVEAPIGMLMNDLINLCGGTTAQIERVIMGGPMMGQMLPGVHTPVIKGASGLIALTAEDIKEKKAAACIRCSSCIKACPMGLVPQEMANLIRHNELDKALEIGLMDCIACGSCSFVCPSSIPLVQYFNYAKGALEMRQRAEHKAKETQKLSEARIARLEAQKRAKAEAAAKRKAEREAKKAKKAQRATDTDAAA